jgi:hypothetical protein
VLRVLQLEVRKGTVMVMIPEFSGGGSGGGGGELRVNGELGFTSGSKARRSRDTSGAS